MALSMSEMELRNFLTDEGVLKGFLCPYCFLLYEAETEAVQCRDSHDELISEFQFFSMGERFPSEVIVKRIVGNKITQIATYERTKIEDVDLRRV